MLTNRHNSTRGAGRPRSGFTLIELIIVIGVIGALTAILISQFSGATESARATECLTHLRNLSTAVQNYALRTEYYPHAGDGEYMDDKEDRGSVEIYYGILKGFITCDEGTYRKYRGSPKSSQSRKILSTYGSDGNFEQREFCVTNSAVWQNDGSMKQDDFVCPSHRLNVKRRHKNKSGPAWSYVMNGYFGYDPKEGSGVTYGHMLPGQVKFGTLNRADKLLLFAELPWNEDTNPKGAELPYSENSDGNARYDGVLRYGSGGKAEWIGLNHKSGSTVFAHLCFADGHTEKLPFVTSAGRPKAKKQDLVKLTTALCSGNDIRQNGGKWEAMNQADNNAQEEDE